MKTTRTTPQTCECGYVFDAHSGLTHEDVPKEGDISVCFGCGRIKFYNIDLTLREPTLNELANLPDEIKHSLEKVVRVHYAFKRRN